jgi:outer membrane protein assembly factor BamB
MRLTWAPGNPALAGNNVYVATVDEPVTIAKLSYPLGAPDGHAAGEIEALNLSTGKIEWDTKVPAMPLGATTVSNDLVFTTLYTGVLVALNRTTGATVYEHQLPTSANAPIAIAGNTILVPAGGPSLYGQKGGSPQLVAYTVSLSGGSGPYGTRTIVRPETRHPGRRGGRAPADRALPV